MSIEAVFLGDPTLTVVNLGGQEVTATSPVVAGPPGRSAYQIAVQQGFVGTKAEWLASLHGADGGDGLTEPEVQALIQIAVDAVVGGAGIDVDTLLEISAILDSNEDALTAIAGQIAAKADASTVTALALALTTHKTSSDHDGRYYTKGQVDTALENVVVDPPDLSGYATLEQTGDVADLETAATDLVGAVNEVKNDVPVIDGYTINFIGTVDQDPASGGGLYVEGDPEYGDDMPGVGDPPFIWLRIVE